MKLHRFFLIAWPSALGAALMEMLVFAVLDPMQIPQIENIPGMTTQGVYSMAFFVFWAAISFACSLTLILSQPVAQKHVAI
ncbi:MAG: hypothetical protein B7Y59_09985 [Burkholderiales bacterium 35-55-47]|nr:MAG: hypothetical protein B7Y59_09985 [Burkholderiales bacterium 35-55-47]OYZ73501.1 MAG: hypothetical protein B7Y06_05560 [Burkholderiales bacterium 24-55-52]OZB00647.1 MAG: hypothetical protein B7X62_05575 [Burkholderiales bacterium 39-55-53]HQS26475.1 hypothetical protein [Limnohabitans sp.]